MTALPPSFPIVATAMMTAQIIQSLALFISPICVRNPTNAKNSGSSSTELKFSTRTRSFFRKSRSPRRHDQLPPGTRRTAHGCRSIHVCNSAETSTTSSTTARRSLPRLVPHRVRRGPPKPDAGQHPACTATKHHHGRRGLIERQRHAAGSGGSCAARISATTKARMRPGR